MGEMCVVLSVFSLLLCAISLWWDSHIVVVAYGSAEHMKRGHALFHLLKTAVLVPTIVVLLFVFTGHMRCDAKEPAWVVRAHPESCPRQIPVKP